MGCKCDALKPRADRRKDFDKKPNLKFVVDILHSIPGI